MSLKSVQLVLSETLEDFSAREINAQLWLGFVLETPFQ